MEDYTRDLCVAAYMCIVKGNTKDCYTVAVKKDAMYIYILFIRN